MFCFLIDCHHFDNFDSTFVDPIVEAKRAGCLEVFGNISLKQGNNTCLIHCEQSDGIERIEVVIESADNQYKIDEIEGVMLTRQGNESEFIETDFTLPFQSEMTHLVVQSILNEQQCHLPDYAESAAIHRVCLTAFLDFFSNKRSDISDICPIS